MKISKQKRWGAAVGLALVASTVGGLAVAAPEFSGDPTSLAWYTGDEATIDDPARTAVGLQLYDASGVEVTSGSVTAALPAFAAAGGTVRANDTHASLFVHAAQSGTAAGAWPGVQATGTDRFTGEGAVTAPAPLAGRPYVHTAGGYTLADAVAAFDGAGQGSFSGVYELRLRTSSATKGVTDSYASAYVKVTGDQWAVVSGPETNTPAVTQTAATAPGSSYYGKAFTVTATVTGAGSSGGTVAVKYGSTVLASKALDADGVIAIPVSGVKLAPGVRALTIAYGGVAGQTEPSQATRSITIVKAKSATVGKLAATTISRTSYPKITARVTATGVPAATFTGTFTVYDGSRAVKKVTLTAANLGKLTITLPKLARGTHYISVVYSGNSKVAKSTSPKYKLVVR
ncbi:hypothetical protein BJ993_004072 [Nocardioides aromaticivorans]|uniref:Bacterial Ig-like domain-containing protein n=1 Tax=Nocardioides aromaticivorans TaxID=200618 RepID=A0A7Y9ZK61_9ACTN|nr:Ig-like domain-containing protein [Nocardioides aromaticivorans]NYI46992.1 hypothetical protein [Nocardioides aromaticivorans]